MSGWTSPVRVRLTAFAVILALFLLGARHGASSGRSQRSQEGLVAGFDRGAAASRAPERGVTPDDAAQGVQDLYGNEVSDAVTTYRINARGSLYEVHSPETRLPHLGSPKG